MLFDLLPQLICECLKQYNEQKIYELRLRINCPIVINYGGKNILLENERKENISAAREIIDYVIRKATENSIYAYNNQMKQGWNTFWNCWAKCYIGRLYAENFKRYLLGEYSCSTSSERLFDCRF